MVIVYAPVAQGIEHRPPEAGAEVRILAGAPHGVGECRSAVEAEIYPAGMDTVATRRGVPSYTLHHVSVVASPRRELRSQRRFLLWLPPRQTRTR